MAGVPDKLTVTYLPVAQLTPYYRNSHQGNVPRIQRSLQTHGQYKAIVVNRGTHTGRPWEVLCGSHTLFAAQTDGRPELGCHVVDVDEDQASQINLIDNPRPDQPADLGYDTQLLLEQLAALPDPALAGYDPGDLTRLEEALAALNNDDTTSRGGGSDPDDAPDVPEQVITRPGDMWLLGPHRLLCGDATNPEDLVRAVAGATVGVVYTDPPYGINVVGTDGKVGDKHGYPFRNGTGPAVPTTKYLPVSGDTGPHIAAAAFHLLTAHYPHALHIWWGANHYAATAQLPDARCWLVWDKDNSTTDFADAELAFTNHPGSVRLLRHMWNGMLRATERGKRFHPTQKPVALAEWAFEQVKTPPDALVLDVFAGSGSTLIAAHQTNRPAVLLEIEPAYCDVICRRWQQHVDELPVLASTGAPTDFTDPWITAPPSENT